MAKFNLKDNKGSIADFTKAININPNFATSYYNRGIAKYYLSDINGACQDARKAKQLGYDASKLINAVCN